MVLYQPIRQSIKQTRPYGLVDPQKPCFRSRSSQKHASPPHSEKSTSTCTFLSAKRTAFPCSSDASVFLVLRHGYDPCPLPPKPLRRIRRPTRIAIVYDYRCQEPFANGLLRLLGLIFVQTTSPEHVPHNPPKSTVTGKRTWSHIRPSTVPAN